VSGKLGYGDSNNRGDAVNQIIIYSLSLQHQQ